MCHGAIFFARCVNKGKLQTADERGQSSQFTAVCMTMVGGGGGGGVRYVRNVNENVCNDCIACVNSKTGANTL